MKGKVLIVGPAFPLRGGLATYNQRLARAFKEEGYEVEILTFKLQYPKFLFPGKTQLSTAEKPLELDINVAMNSVSPLNWIKVGNKYKNKKYNYAIFRYWMPFMAPCLGTIARRIVSNKHTICLAITDNIIPHEKRVGDEQLTKYFVKSMDGFLTMSKSVLQDLKEFDKSKPKVYNPHPLYDDFGPLVDKNEAKKELKLESDASYILFFGFIRDYKGLDLLLESFATCNFGSKKVKLLIAGEYYTNKEKYLNLIKELNLTNKVELHTDFIPDSRVPLYFSACDLVAQTYKSATQSGVTQIAYYYEKPMLVTNVGGLSELVPNEKVGYVCALDKSDISSKLENYFNESKEAEFANNMKTEKQRFSWSSLVNNLLNLVNK